MYEYTSDQNWLNNVILLYRNIYYYKLIIYSSNDKDTRPK